MTVPLSRIRWSSKLNRALSRLPTLCAPQLPLCPLCQTADSAHTTPFLCLCSPLMAAALPVPLLTQEGLVLPSSKCIVTALRLVVRLGVSLFPLFTPQCQHTIHHARSISLSPCLISSFCLTSDGGTTVCDTAQVDHMVESLLLHRNPLALRSALSSTATIWCKFSVVNPVLVTHTGAELVNAIRFHAQPAAVTQYHCLHFCVGRHS